MLNDVYDTIAPRGLLRVSRALDRLQTQIDTLAPHGGTLKDLALIVKALEEQREQLSSLSGYPVTRLISTPIITLVALFVHATVLGMSDPFNCRKALCILLIALFLRESVRFLALPYYCESHEKVCKQFNTLRMFLESLNPSMVQEVKPIRRSVSKVL